MPSPFKITRLSHIDVEDDAIGVRTDPSPNGVFVRFEEIEPILNFAIVAWKALAKNKEVEQRFKSQFSSNYVLETALAEILRDTSLRLFEPLLDLVVPDEYPRELPSLPKRTRETEALLKWLKYLDGLCSARPRKEVALDQFACGDLRDRLRLTVTELQRIDSALEGIPAVVRGGAETRAGQIEQACLAMVSQLREARINAETTEAEVGRWRKAAGQFCGDPCTIDEFEAELPEILKAWGA